MLNRHRAAARAVEALGLERPRVLDAGCRDDALARALARALPAAGIVRLDRAEGAMVRADLARLPFAARSFDVVASLDVLEHCDDLAGAFAECLRVADRLLLLSLPNMAHPVFRLRFAATGRLSGKYDLGDATQADRHRWLTPLAQADALVATLAARAGATMRVQRLTEGRRAAALAALLRPIGVHPQLWAWTSLYAVER